MKIKWITLCIAILTYCEIFAQKESSDLQAKCYCKLLIRTQKRELIPTKIKLCVYDGDKIFRELDPKYVEEMTLEIIPKFVEWTQKLSSISDQLVLCKNEIPAVKRDFFIVKDTINFKAFKIIEVETFEVIPGSYKEQYREVVCDEKITQEFRDDLAMLLKDKGIIVEDTSNEELNKGIMIFEENSNLDFHDTSQYPSLCLKVETFRVLEK